MLKDVIRAIDYSESAEWALILFIIAFGLVIVSTLKLSRKTTDRYASIPLSDDKVEDPRHE
jgi:hypothetical protein